MTVPHYSTIEWMFTESLVFNTSGGVLQVRLW